MFIHWAKSKLLKTVSWLLGNSCLHTFACAGLSAWDRLLNSHLVMFAATAGTLSTLPKCPPDVPNFWEKLEFKHLGLNMSTSLPEFSVYLCKAIDL